MTRISYRIIKPLCVAAFILAAAPSFRQYILKEAVRKALVYNYSEAIPLYKKHLKENLQLLLPGVLQKDTGSSTTMYLPNPGIQNL